MLRGIWESETRKQNGHYQSALGSVPSEWQNYTIPKGEYRNLAGMTDTDSGDYIYFSNGYIPETTPILQESYEVSGITVRDYGDVKYIPNTGLLTYLDNDSYYSGSRQWFRRFGPNIGNMGPSITFINLGNANESGTGITQMNIADIVKPWVIPTFRILKTSGYTPGLYDYLFDRYKINTFKFKRKYNLCISDQPGPIATYGASADNKGPRGLFANNFRITFDDLTDFNRTYMYEGTQNYVQFAANGSWTGVAADNFVRFRGNAFILLNDGQGGYERCITILKKLEVESRPMTF